MKCISESLKVKVLFFITRVLFFLTWRCPFKKKCWFLKYSMTGLFKKGKTPPPKLFSIMSLKNILENSRLSEDGISRESMCIAQVTGVLGKTFSQHTFLVTWADERKFLDITAKPSELTTALCTHLVGSRRTSCLSKKTRTCSGIFLWLLEKFAAWKQHIWAATFWTEKRIRT